MKRIVPVQLVAAVIALAACTQAARAQHGQPCAQPCPQPCCEELKKICVPECGTKKVTKYYYDCRCEDYCLTKCSCFRFTPCNCLSKCFHKGCCEPCPCPEPACETCHECECAPRTRKVLIKYTKVTEEPDYKCVPACTVVPPKCCPAPCYGGPVYGGSVIVAPGGRAPAAPEMLPPPKVEKKQ